MAIDQVQTIQSINADLAEGLRVPSNLSLKDASPLFGHSELGGFRELSRSVARIVE